jgi:hypothetical protein
VLLKGSESPPVVRAFDPKQPHQTTDRTNSFLEENEIIDQSKKAKKLVVLTGSKQNTPCECFVSHPPQTRRTMSTTDKPNRQPVPPPTITYPEEGKKTGVATLFLGSGIPGALVQVWNIENTHSLGGGQVSANGRWAFSFSGAQSSGQQVIRAHQTWEGIKSDWSEERSYTVLLKPELDAPVIFEPKEGAQVDAIPVFSGDVTEAEGFVSIIDLDTGEVIANADVDPLKQWLTQVTKPLPPGPHRISALHNIKGTLSDWVRVRTFTVTAKGKGKT